MGGEAEDIDIIILHIYRDMTCRLGSIDTKYDAVAAAECTYLADGEGVATDI